MPLCTLFHSFTLVLMACLSAHFNQRSHGPLRLPTYHQLGDRGRSGVMSVNRRLLRGLQWWRHALVPSGASGSPQSLSTMAVRYFLYFFKCNLKRETGRLSYNIFYNYATKASGQMTSSCRMDYYTCTNRIIQSWCHPMSCACITARQLCGFSSTSSRVLCYKKKKMKCKIFLDEIAWKIINS